MTREQRERLGAAQAEAWGVLPEDIAAIRAALLDVDALAKALIGALRTMAAAREMLGVFEDHGGHDGLNGKGYVATLDQIHEASASARIALTMSRHIP